MLRKILCLLLAVILIFSLSGCQWQWILLLPMIEQSNDMESKQDTFTFVQENQDMLLLCIKQREASTLEGYGIIKSVTESGNYIEFYCGGSGFGAETNYSGFFYSKNGNINAARSYISPDDMLPKDDGYYWEDEIGDDSYYVENICGNFYYYLEHY